MTSHAGPEEINPKDWHVDVQMNYMTWRPGELHRSLGFYVTLRFTDDSDRLSPANFVAEIIHWPASGEVPSFLELERLSRVAAHLFAIRYLARLEKQKARNFPHQPHKEDAA